MRKEILHLFTYYLLDILRWSKKAISCNVYFLIYIFTCINMELPDSQFFCLWLESNPDHLLMIDDCIFANFLCSSSHVSKFACQCWTQIQCSTIVLINVIFHSIEFCSVELRHFLPNVHQILPEFHENNIFKIFRK